MDEDFGARGSERGAVVVERAMYLGVGGEMWVYARASQEIEGDERLW